MLKNSLLFIWNSGLTWRLLFLFATSGNCKPEWSFRGAAPFYRWANRLPRPQLEGPRCRDKLADDQVQPFSLSVFQTPSNPNGLILPLGQQQCGNRAVLNCGGKSKNFDNEISPGVRIALTVDSKTKATIESRLAPRIRPAPPPGVLWPAWLHLVKRFRENHKVISATA